MDSIFKDKLYQFETQNAFKNEQQEEEKPLVEEKEQLQQKGQMKFSDMTEMFLHISDPGSYKYKDGDELKVAERQTRQNSSMYNVIEGLKALNAKLNEAVTPEDLLNEDRVKEAQSPFLTVCEACRTYLKRHKKNPWTAEGRARRQMVQDLLDQTSNESIEFYERAKSYRENGIPEGLEVNTWNDVVQDVRTEVIDTTKEGTKVTLGGAGTSKLLIIESKDETGQTVKKFFKEAEEVPSEDYKDCFQKEIDKLKAASEDQRASEAERADSAETQRMLEVIFRAVKRLSGDARNRGLDGKDIDTLFSNIKMELPDNVADQIDDWERDKSKEKQFKKLKELVWMIKQDSTLGFAAQNTAKIKKGNSLSKKNAAASRLADILGVGDVIVKTKMARLVIDGKEVRGVLMDEAKGENMAEISQKQIDTQSKKITYTNDAYRKLFNMQIFDTICGQIDRHQNNYRVEGKKKGGGFQVEDFKGIDNDMCFGNLKFKDIAGKGKDSYFNMHKITNKDGEFALHAVEEEFYGRIMAVQEDQLRFQMADLLDKDELDALVDRIKGVQRVLREAVESHKTKLISKTDDAGWTNERKAFAKKVNDKDPKAFDSVIYFSYISPMAFEGTRRFLR